MTNTSVDTAVLIQQMNDKKVRVLLPAIVYIAVLMVSGLIGNLMVCFYYGFKTKTVPTSIFIVTLAAYDLIFCSISMPVEITDIARFYTFQSGPACKILRFINYTASIASALTLVTIAIDRFNHIRRAMRKQMTVKDAKRNCIIVAAGAVLLSWPIVIIYNAEQVPVPNELGLDLKGYDCTFVKDKPYKPYVWAYNIVLVLGFIVCTIILTALYSMVAWTIKKHRNRLAKYQHDISHTSEVQMSSTTSDTHEDGSKAHHTNDSIAAGEIELKHCSRAYTEQQDDSKQNHRTDEDKDLNNKSSTQRMSNSEATKEQTKERHSKADIRSVVKPTSVDTKHNETIRITILMLAITLVFVVSFLPYLSLIIWRSLAGVHEGELSNAGLVGFKIGSRSFLLNSSINPWIYGFFNSRFRTYYYKLFCCKYRK